ncbi:transketolase family protein [bacterium]|nr:transketolase family protein [bacterium]
MAEFKPDTDKKSMRVGFGEVLVDLGKKNPDIVVLDADLMESTKTDAFEKAFPERFIQVGVAEQNMASMAAGLALSGKIPFVTTFGIFCPGRNWEQIRLSVCFSNANVKFVSTHCGLSHCHDGGMAQALEDIALTRVLPNMTVICPADYYETKKAVEAAAETTGPMYIRLGREPTELVTQPKDPFEIGKAQVLAEGKDLTVISTGAITFEAVKAANDLKAKHGTDVEIISCSTIKPLDEKTILESAKKTGKVVTVEEHQINGGLGGAVAELLSEKLPTKLLRIGVEDTFAESGTYKELKDKYGLSAHRIEDKIVKFFGE